MRTITAILLSALVFAPVLLVSTPATATPWAVPGDAQLRRDIELLAAYGIADGPLTTWPMPWAQVSRGIARADLGTLPPHVQRAAQRVKARLPKRRDYRGFGLEGAASGSNEPRIVRGFGGGAREKVDLRVSADVHGSSSYARLSVNFRDDARDGDIQFDDSYAAKALGNWIFYGGFVDQWWGPGNDSALTLSNNARPMPKVGLMRLDPRPFKTRWLSWLGPWQFNMFAARMSGDRSDFAHPILAGVRFTFQPISGLDVGISRTMQLCGAGRPCGFKTWADALIGVGNADNTGSLDEPGNQLAAFDIRYSRRIGANSLAIYGELMGEDEDNYFIDRMSALIGASLGGNLASQELAWQFNAEYTDTKANRLVGKNVFDRLTYQHFIYRDGYRYRDRALGSSVDGDSRLLTIGGVVTDSADRGYWLRYRYADINDSDYFRNRASANRETINMIEAGSLVPTRFGQISAELRYSDDLPNTPGASDRSIAFELGWKRRF